MDEIMPNTQYFHQDNKYSLNFFIFSNKNLFNTDKISSKQKDNDKLENSLCILKWNIQYKNNFDDILTNLKENFIYYFEDIKKYEKISILKSKISLNLRNVVETKSEIFLRVFKNLFDCVRDKNIILQKKFQEHEEYFEKIFKINNSIFSDKNKLTHEKLKKLFQNCNNPNNFHNISDIYNYFEFMNYESNQENLNDEKPFSIKYEIIENLHKILKNSDYFHEKINNDMQDSKTNINRLSKIFLNDIKIFINLLISEIEEIIHHKLIFDEYSNNFSKENFKISLDINEPFNIHENSSNYILMNTNIFQSDFFFFIECNNINVLKPLFFDEIEEIKYNFPKENFLIDNSKNNLINKYELVFLNKKFDFQKFLFNFMKENSSKFTLNKNDSQINKNLSNRKFTEFYYNKRIYYEIDYNKTEDEKFSLLLNIKFELNIFRLIEMNCHKENSKSKEEINKNDLSLIFSKNILIKTIILKYFKNNKDEEKSKIKGKDLNFIDYQGIITLNFIDYFVLSDSDKQKFTSIFNENNNLNSINEDKIDDCFIILNKIIDNLSVINTFFLINNDFISYITFKSKSFKESTLQENTVEENANEIIKNENRKNKNLMLCLDLINSNIYLGEIIKDKNKLNCCFDYKNDPISNFIIDLNFGNNTEFNSNNVSYEYDFENNLKNILNKNKIQINQKKNNSDKENSDFIKKGFGIEIFYNDFFLNNNSTNKNNESKDLFFYFGYFDNNKYACIGFINKLNYFYFGLFENGYKNGFGYLFFKLELDFYIGKTINNDLKGEGIYIFNDNPIIKFFIGEFQNNLANGTGIIIYKNNHLYSGNFIDNVKVKKGKYINTEKKQFYVNMIFDFKNDEDYELTKFSY